MSIEMRAALLGILAGLIAVGGAFTLAAVVRATDHAVRASSTETVAHVASGSQARQPNVATQAALVRLGKGFFAASCASCHGSEGQGIDGPNLQNTALSAKEIEQRVTQGIPPNMPPFGSTYSPHDIAAIAAYVRTLK